MNNWEEYNQDEYITESEDDRDKEELFEDSLDTESIEYVAEEKYKAFTDDEIVEMFRSGDDRALEYLLNKYKFVVRIKARTYFLAGADREDIIQEGMIGLYKAVMSYNADKQSSFKAFADLCITRQIITAVKTSNRLKNKPLNSYISLNKPAYDEDSEKTLMDFLENSMMDNPEDIIIHNENLRLMEKKFDTALSKLEKRVLDYYLDGKSYQDIATAIDKSTKSVDNAIQRIRNKLTPFITQQLRENA